MNKIAMYKEQIYKEAGVVSHASKATNGIKRAGQLLTGSYAKGLKKSLNNMQNKGPMNLKESLKTGEKMMLTQKELGKEVKKVRAARAGVAGTAGAGALGLNNSKEQEINV